MMIYGIVTTMLTEYIPRQSASLVAVNSLGCNMVMAMSTVVAQPLISRIGNGYSFTILACFVAMSLIAVVIMRRFGPKWRDNMNEKIILEPTTST